MRFTDRHGRPRPLADVFAEHQKDVKTRLRAAEAARLKRLDAALTDIVIVRGTSGGVSSSDRAREYRRAQRIPDRLV